MQELYLDERTCSDETGNHHTFRYFLLTDELSVDGTTCADYGVMICSDGDEQTRIPHITTDYERISDLIAQLQNHTVSPIHLRDVIDDWL